MDLRRFDLNLLITLDALLTERNVTRAGVRMNLSQSAMSGALARLRDSFEDELLVPIGRTMVLTPLAQELAQPIRDVLLRVQATIAIKPRFDPVRSARRFSIALSDYVTSVLMVDLLRDLQRQAPSTTFELRPVGKGAVDALESGALDLLITAEPFASAVHPKQLLFEDTHTCIAWNGNSRLGSTISEEEYVSLGHVIVHVGEIGSANYDERMLRAQNRKRNIAVVTPSFDLAPQLLIGTDRIATVPTMLARKYAALLPIKLLRVPVVISPLIEVVQWHPAYDHDPAHAWFRSQLQTRAALVQTADTATLSSDPRTPSDRRSPGDALRGSAQRRIDKRVSRGRR